MATSSEVLVELDIDSQTSDHLLPTQRSLDTLTLSEAPDTSQLDTFSLSAELGKPTENWQMTSYKKENERLRNQVVKLRKALDSEKEQLKFIKKDAQETLVRVRREERETLRHKHSELRLKLEKQNQGQLKSSESHWQNEVVRLQGDIRQLRQETTRLKLQKQNLESAKNHTEEIIRKLSREHESEMESLRRAGGHDVRKQHDELRTRDKELRENKRELEHVTERALRMESKVDELETTLARLKGGLSLDKASPRALLISKDASIGNRSYSDVTTPLHSKEAVVGWAEEGEHVPRPVGDKDRLIVQKNAELSALAHRLDEKVKKLAAEKQELLDKLKKGQLPSDPLKEDNRKLSSKCSDLSNSLRRTEESERHAMGVVKRMKLNQTQLENQISDVKQELTAEKSKTIRHKLGRQQLERAHVELKRSQTELTTHKDTIRSLEKEREDLKKRIDLLKHSKKLLSEERDKAMKHSSQMIEEQAHVNEKEWENASQASFIQAEMDQVVFERDELRASIAQLHLEHLTLQRANSLLNELSATSGSKESVESDLNRSDELERIENELKISNDRVAELEDKLSVVELGELEQQLDTLTRSLICTEAELSAAFERIIDLEGQISTSMVEEKERQATILQLHGQIEQLQEEMSANTLTHEVEIEIVRAEKARLDEQLDDKINRVTELEVSLSEAINVTSQLEDRLEQLSSEKVEMEMKSESDDTSNIQLLQLETDIRTAGKELEMITNEKNILSNEVSELRESLKHMTELKETSEVERDTLLERLEQVKQELSVAQEEKDQLRDKLSVAEASLVGEQQLSEKLQVMEELNKRTSEEKAVLQMKTDQLGVIECELETSRRDLERLGDRERELEGDIRVLKLEKEESLLDITICRESLTKEIEKLTEEKNNLVEVYSMQLSEAQSEIDNLRSVTNIGEVPSEGVNPSDTALQSRLELLTQQLEEAHTQRDRQEREREENLLAKQTELDQVQYNLQDTEGKLAEALQSALQMSQGVSLDSPTGVNESEMKQELKVHVEAALVNLRDGVDGSTEEHIRDIQRIIEHMSFTQNQEPTGISDEFSFNNIVVEIDNEKELLRQELAEIQEAFSALEEELEETRSALQSFQNQEKDLTQKNKLINDLRSQVSDLKVIISCETQRNQREKSSPGSLGDEHSITASLLDSPQSRFLEPRLFVTLFDYDPMSLCTTGHPERQLPLKAGDIIVVHGDMNATAHYQATHGGTAGLVPANFIEELIISDPLARQRLLHQSLSPEKRGLENTDEPPEDTYTSSDEENIGSSQTVVRIPMPVSGLCVEKVFQDSIVLKWEPPRLSSSGKSNGAYVLGYRALVNNEPKKDVIGALQTKCLLEGLTSGVPLTIQVVTLSDNDLSSRPCTIQHPPISSTHSRPSTASSHFSLPASLADTISPATSSSTILEPSHNVVAIYDYIADFDSPNANHEFELSFKEGDQIIVFGSVMEDGFYFGELSGKKGLVPSNFVQESNDSEIQTLDTSQVINPAKNRPQSSDSQSLPVSTPEPQLSKSKQVLALYSYDPYTMSPNDNPEIELAFKEGDIIKVQGDMDKYGFFQGEMEGGLGLIPSNFVTELDADSTATRPESSDSLPLPEIQPPSDNDTEETPSFRQEKTRKGVFKKGKNFVKKLGLIGSPTPRNPKSG